MSTSKNKRQGLISKYQKSERDTGSVEVQCAIFSQRVAHLLKHLTIHKKDHSCRRGLIKLVGRRKKALSYLEDRFGTEYKSDFTQKLEEIKRESA